MASNPSNNELKELLQAHKKAELDRANKEKAREALVRIQFMLSRTVVIVEKKSK